MAVLRRRSLKYVVLGQFISTTADSALLLVAIAVVVGAQEQAWLVPALRILFYLTFVLLSPFAGAVADAWHKKSLLFCIGVLKAIGCLLMMVGVTPLVAYTMIAVGSAMHGPARYGMLAEISLSDELTAANAWMEIASISGLLIGTVWGGLLLQGFGSLPISSGSALLNAVITLGMSYIAASVCILPARVLGRVRATSLVSLGAIREDFARGVRELWNDPVARVSLAATSLFWGSAAVLQFIVLGWGVNHLGLTLATAAMLQGVVAAGVILGAAAAGRWVPDHRSLSVLPLGLALGVCLMVMTSLSSVTKASAFLLAFGVLSGLLLVPMNSLLQKRGGSMARPGRTLGVQNFVENLSALFAITAYGGAVSLGMTVSNTAVILGAFLTVAMMYTLALSRRLVKDPA